MKTTLNDGQMAMVFDRIFEGCDTIVMTTPGTRLINNQPRIGFTLFAGNYGQSDFRIYSCDLMAGDDIQAGYEDTEALLSKWMLGRQIVAHLGMTQEVAVDMVRVMFPGQRAEHLFASITKDIARKLN